MKDVTAAPKGAILDDARNREGDAEMTEMIDAAVPEEAPPEWPARKDTPFRRLAARFASTRGGHEYKDYLQGDSPRPAWMSDPSLLPKRPPGRK